MAAGPPYRPDERTWKTYFAEIRSRTPPKMRGFAEADVEDCIQAAAAKLWHFFERNGEPDSVEGLIEVIVRRTVASFIRREQVRRRFFTPGDPSDSIADQDERELREIEEEVAWKSALVLAYFRKANAKCLPLAEARSQGEDFKRFSERVALSHALIRKRWQHCAERAREVLRASGVYWGAPRRRPRR